MKKKEPRYKKSVCAYVHKVAAGETLYKIARHYGVDYGRLMALNGITNPYNLRIGTEICIPPSVSTGIGGNCAGYYTIREGDTLYSIARNFGLDLDDLMAANSDVDPYNMHIGMKICIPPRNPVNRPTPRTAAQTQDQTQAQTQAQIQMQEGASEANIDTANNMQAADASRSAGSAGTGNMANTAGAAGTARHSKGMARTADGTAQNAAGTARTATGVAQNAAATTQNSTGMAQAATGAAQNAAATTQNSTGMAQAAAGAAQDSAETARTATGTAQNSSKTARTATGTAHNAASTTQISTGTAQTAAGTNAAHSAGSSGSSGTAGARSTTRGSGSSSRNSHASAADTSCDYVTAPVFSSLDVSKIRSNIAGPSETTNLDSIMTAADMTSSGLGNSLGAAGGSRNAQTAQNTQNTRNNAPSSGTNDMIYTVLEAETATRPSNSAGSSSARSSAGSAAPGSLTSLPYVSDTMPDGIIYNVEQGETLTDILRKFGICFSALDYNNSSIDLNSDLSGATLNIPYGDKICIAPNNQPYIIRRNDTLDNLSVRFDISTDELLRLNPTKRPDDFSSIGSRINISGDI